jgi:ATP/maltotriose-dependent transcriptional regulator MalT
LFIRNLYVSRGRCRLSTRFTPRTPESLLSRERLLQRLDGAVSRRLTLVRAPAGFGKTTCWRSGTGTAFDKGMRWPG